MIAYHEAGHALLARLMSDDIHKVTIVPRGRALGFMMSLPEEDRYVLSKDELEDWLKVTLGGRAAEQMVFGRITNGAANDLDRATAIARSMVFEWGMGTSTASQQMRADNYALSEETKRLRDERAARDHRQRLRRGAAAGRAPPPPTSTCWPTRCSRRRRSSATRSTAAVRPRAGVERVRPDRRRAAARSRPGRRPAARDRAALGAAGRHTRSTPLSAGPALRGLSADRRRRWRSRRLAAAAACRRPPRRSPRPCRRLGGRRPRSLTAAISASLAAIRRWTSAHRARGGVELGGILAEPRLAWSRCAARPSASSASFSSFLRLRSCICSWPVLAVSCVFSTTVQATSVACCLILSRKPI